MAGAGWVLVAAVAFVATHFLLSHPLRRPLVGRIGEGAFTGVYSLVSFATLGWMAWAYWTTPPGPALWVAGNGVWAVVTAVMLLASVLLAGSLVRNPALPTGGALPAAPEEARGVFAVTRHPMMWSVALWGLCHIVVLPNTKNVIVAAAMTVLALVGAALQDRKKERLQPTVWKRWEAKTSYWPGVAMVQGRARLGGFGWPVLVGGVAVWLVATWAHLPLSGWAAGI